MLPASLAVVERVSSATTSRTLRILNKTLPADPDEFSKYFIFDMENLAGPGQNKTALPLNGLTSSIGVVEYWSVETS